MSGLIFNLNAGGCRRGINHRRRKTIVNVGAWLMDINTFIDAYDQFTRLRKQLDISPEKWTPKCLEEVCSDHE